MLVRFNRLESLASPAFMAALALLVLNDFALKPLLHNAPTSDVTLGPVSDRDGILRVRLGRRSSYGEPLHRTIAAELARRLGAEFGSGNVTTHVVSAAPLEWVY